MINFMHKLFGLMIAHAEVIGGGGSGGGIIENPINVNSLGDFVNKILEIVIQVGMPVLVVALVYVGFMFVAARGNEEGLKKAKNALLTVVIGAAIVLGAFVISSAIKATVGSLEVGR